MRRDRRRAANNNLRSAVQVIKCGKCGEPVMPHRACSACGTYGNRQAVPVAASGGAAAAE
jgi:large subunit ribosomal protein L32